MEDGEQDLPGDVHQALVLETLPALAEGDLGLANTEPHEVAVDQEEPPQLPGKAGQLEQLEQAAWRERERGEVRACEVSIYYRYMGDGQVRGEHFLSSCLSILVSYRDSSSGGHRPPVPP